MDLEPQLKERLAALVASDEVVLFMKGQREMPQCGFSAAVVGVLDQYLPDYSTVDVLADQEVREGIKVFSEWPTIPQLYLRGEFLGGCDIVREMDASGELKEALGSLVREPETPEITLTPAAAEMVRNALSEAADDSFLRLQVDSHFRNDLFLGPREPGDVAVEAGDITIMLDRGSARRAAGMNIDFVDIGTGQGFKIDNPNAPEREEEPELQKPKGTVRQMTVQQLKAKLDGGDAFDLIDVRTPGEREVALIEGSRPFDPPTMAELQGKARDTTLVFHCKSGQRSQQAAEHFVALGFTEVFNVTGGIDAWLQEIEAG